MSRAAHRAAAARGGRAHMGASKQASIRCRDLPVCLQMRSGNTIRSQSTSSTATTPACAWPRAPARTSPRACVPSRTMRASWACSGRTAQARLRRSGHGCAAAAPNRASVVHIHPSPPVGVHHCSAVTALDVFVSYGINNKQPNHQYKAVMPCPLRLAVEPACASLSEILEAPDHCCSNRVHVGDDAT